MRNVTHYRLKIADLVNCGFINDKSFSNLPKKMDKQTFVHVLEDEFIDFYNKYFTKYTVDDDGIMTINNELIPISYDYFIYWLYTTDNITGVNIHIKFGRKNVTRKIRINNNTLQIFADKLIPRLFIMLENVEYLKHQLLEIRHAFKQINIKSEHGRLKYTANGLFNCIEKIDIDISDVISTYLVELPEIENIDVNPVVYKTYGDLMQMTTTYCDIYHDVEDDHTFKNIIMKDNRYIVSEGVNFALILTGRYYEKFCWDEPGCTSVNFIIYMLPITYYYKTIGYHLNILEGYYGNARNMQGFTEWLQKEGWDQPADDDEELYMKVRKKIIEKYIFG